MGDIYSLRITCKRVRPAKRFGPLCSFRVQNMFKEATLKMQMQGHSHSYLRHVLILEGRHVIVKSIQNANAN